MWAQSAQYKSSKVNKIYTQPKHNKPTNYINTLQQFIQHLSQLSQHFYIHAMNCTHSTYKQQLKDHTSGPSVHHWNSATNNCYTWAIYYFGLYQHITEIVLQTIATLWASITIYYFGLYQNITEVSLQTATLWGWITCCYFGLYQHWYSNTLNSGPCWPATRCSFLSTICQVKKKKKREKKKYVT